MKLHVVVRPLPRPVLTPLAVALAVAFREEGEPERSRGAADSV